MVCGECCSILIAILFPPLGLCCYKGCGTQTCLCLCLTILCPYVGGLIYAIVVICQGPDQKQSAQVIISNQMCIPSSAPPVNPVQINMSPYSSQPIAAIYGQQQFHYPQHFPQQLPGPQQNQTMQVITPHQNVYIPSSAPPVNPGPLNISPYPSQPSAPMYGQQQFDCPQHFRLQPPYPAEQRGFVTPVALQPPPYSELPQKSG